MIRRPLLVALVAGSIVLGAGAASAEAAFSQLIDASPGVDAVVVRAPEDIALSFRTSLEELTIRLIKDNTVVSDSTASIEGGLAIAPVDTDGEGSYLVDWKGTDVSGASVAGAYVFVVDSRGTGSIAVEREIAGASGALGGLRVLAAVAAAVAVVTLLVHASAWARLGAADTPPRLVGVAAAVTAVGALAAGATYGVPSDGSPVDVLDLSVLRYAAGSTPGRAWLAAMLMMGVMPFLLTAARTLRTRWIPIGAVLAGVLSATWVSVGLGWLLRLPWFLMAAGLAAAMVFWISSSEGRLTVVAVAAVAGIAVVVPSVVMSRGAGDSSAVQTGDLLIEASLDPARSGVNELHIYGFDVSGRNSSLGPTGVVAYHEVLDVGPLALPVLRAGPNHFLSYRAILPLSGDWTLRIDSETSNGESEQAVMEMELR
ncbi:MAG: copper resistance protein CopC [Acidimicrobiia bacterium]